ncbi:uncharacterized protein LOC129762608 [Toxorhynchites rutilus septentrionalis]|uniref:uncharacterized protein LOC129762608 n=1 Tax=Toxorhynchites rutilus septentrionalis TaxID=329112 RepID=UPI002478FA4A|nr:uncharacterized protein LOC129762608 [Toxorhynchites rutilus septentrionalis]
MTYWKRPDGFPYPQVWRRFQVRDPLTGELEAYRVQDLPPERFEDAIDHMCNHFLRDEPICASLNLVGDTVGIEELSAVWRRVVEQRCAVVCFKEASDEIIGLNMLTVVSKEDSHKEPLKFKSAAVQTFVDCTLYLTEKGNLFERHHIDHFLSAWGLSVHPNFRRRGLATEILSARDPICRAFGLSLSATVFSHPGSQIPAAKVGFQEEVVEKFADLANVGFRIPTKVEYNKLMTLKIS